MPIHRVVPCAYHTKFALALCVGLATVATLEVAAAKTMRDSSPLAGAPAVRNMRLYRDGRVHFKPTVGLALQNGFNRTSLVGFQLQYHVADWLGIALWGANHYQHNVTQLTTILARPGRDDTRSSKGLNLPDRGSFAEQIGRINAIASVQATVIPLRGKVALFRALFVDTDVYVFAGAAAVNLEERPMVTGVAALACTNPTSPQFSGTDSNAACLSTQRRESRWSVTATFGMGLTFYLSRFAGVTLEYRALPLSWNVSGTDERGLSDAGAQDPYGAFPDGEIDGDDRVYHLNHVVNVGVVLMLPTSQQFTD